MLSEITRNATPNHKHLIEECSDRPNYLSPILDQMPQSLRLHPIWVYWKADWKINETTGQGRWSKTPRCVFTKGKKARSNDPNTWVNFDEAAGQWPFVQMDGLGIMLRHGLVGLDIDNCVDRVTQAILPEAKGLLDYLGAYCEYSPSGTGIKALFFGSLADLLDLPGYEGIRVQDLPKKKKFPRGFEVEVYDQTSPRYFTITGRRVEGFPSDIIDRQSQLRRIYNDVFKHEIPKAVESGNRRERAAITKRDAVKLDISDAKVIDLASTAANKDRFLALYRDGSLAGHQDDRSRADLGLCQHLAFWCGDDSERIDRLFRSSALMREKRERDDYRTRTIDRAITQTAEFYDWSAYHPIDDSRLEEVLRDQGGLNSVTPEVVEPEIVPNVPAGIDQFRDHQLFGYLWRNNHSRLDDQDRERRMRSVLKVLDLIPRSGFFYNYIAAQLPSSDCSVMYHLATALTIAGHACNRKLKVQFGSKAILPNIWACVLGASSVAHKTSAINAGKKMLAIVDEESIISDAFSFEAMLDQIGIIVKPDDQDPRSLLTRAREICRKEEDGASISGLTNYRGLGFFHGSELGAWLQTLEKSPGSKESLTDLFDNKVEYSKRTRGTGLYFVPNPFVSILMASTKEWLVNNSSDSDIQGGFLPRWLFFGSETKDYISAIPDPADPGHLERAEESFKAMSERTAYVCTDRKNEFTDHYSDWRVRVEKRYQGDDVLLSWVSRMGDAALKIAVLYEASTNAQARFTTISLDNIRRATDLVDLLLAELKETLRSIAFDAEGKDVAKVRRLVKAAGKKGISHSDLLRKSKFTARAIGNLIDTLVQAEEIIIILGQAPEAGGKQPKSYRWAG
jgi:hypothetical protein